MIEPITHQCTECSYSTVVKSNLIRHIKAKHENNTDNQRVITTNSIENITNKRQNPPIDKSVIDNPVIDNSHDAEPEIDIEDYVTQKVSEILKANDLPQMKVSKNLLRSCFSGTIPSFFAGSFVGLILSNYIPMLMMMFKKKTLLHQAVALSAPTVVTETESNTAVSVSSTAPSL